MQLNQAQGEYEKVRHLSKKSSASSSAQGKKTTISDWPEDLNALSKWAQAESENARALHAYTSKLLTSESHEDLKSALPLAEKACELTAHMDSACLGTLALAQFHNNMADKAARTQRKAIHHLPKEGKGELRQAYEERLKQYEAAARRLPSAAPAEATTERSGKMRNATPAVTAIDIIGNQGIDAETILGCVETKVGQPLAKGALARDMHRLWKLNAFEDVQIHSRREEEGLALRVVVKERLPVRHIAIDGCRQLDRAGLEAALELKPGHLADGHTAHRHAEELRREARRQGFPFAQVTPRVEELPSDHSAAATRDGVVKMKDVKKTVKVVFHIDEGPRLASSGLSFHGNATVSAKSLTKTVLYRPAEGSDEPVLNAEMLATWPSRLQAFYQERGRLDCRIGDILVELRNAREGGEATVYWEPARQRFLPEDFAPSWQEEADPESCLRSQERDIAAIAAYRTREDVIGKLQCVEAVVHVCIEEGPLYTVEKISFERPESLEIREAALRGVLQTQTGDPCSKTRAHADAQRLVQMLKERTGKTYEITPFHCLAATGNTTTLCFQIKIAGRRKSTDLLWEKAHSFPKAPYEAASQ